MVQVLLGAEGIKQAYEMTFKAQAMDIKCLSRHYKKVVGDYFDNTYWPKVLQSSIKTREIILNTEEGRKYAEDLNTDKNTVAFVEKHLQNESDFIIFDNTVILISYNQEAPFAVCIEDKETATSMKIQFELMWKAADK